VVSICHNISCDLRGAPAIIERVCELTGAPLGGTSPDGRWTVRHVECQGACANAPMFDLDGTYHEDLTPEKAERILGGVR
jgi:NADH-quinone oxidoreductase subunit E